MVVVLLSGGLDSVCTLGIVKGKYKNIRAIGIDYDQSNRIELDYAGDICSDLRIEYTVMRVQNPYRNTLEGKWGRMSRLDFRNGLFLSMVATRLGKDKIIVMGLEADSHNELWDTHIGFIDSMTQSLRIGLGNDKIKIWTPAHIGMTRKDIIKKGHSILGDIVFNSYSCYEGYELQCGRCMVCKFRHHSIMEAIGYDNTHYSIIPKQLTKKEIGYA